jgi:hypothetical protein
MRRRFRFVARNYRAVADSEELLAIAALALCVYQIKAKAKAPAAVSAK